MRRARQVARIEVAQVEPLIDELAADALQPGSPICGKAYFITNNDPVNCWQWINEILELADLPRVERRISLRQAYAAGWVLEKLWTLLGRTDEPRMTRFLAAQLGTSHHFDIAAARRDLGYVPAVSMVTGMERLRLWMGSRTRDPAGEVGTRSVPAT